MFYRIKENKVYDCADYLYSDECIELKNIKLEQYEKDPYKYIIENNELVLNPQYDVIVKQREKKERVEELKKELDKLDLKSIRAIRANDIEYINKYEAEAEILREEIRKLEN